MFGEALAAKQQSRSTLAWVIGITLLACLVYLQWSLANGRLRHDIGYDDIAYVTEAESRLAVLREGGFVRLIEGFFQDPPHSPVWTTLSMSVLLLGGRNDLAFYCSTWFLVLGVVLFLRSEFGGLGPGFSAWAVAFFLLSPLPYATVENFRPDFALGFASTAMMWWLLKGIRTDSIHAIRLAGVALGGALLIKPSFFAHTVALALGGGILVVGSQLLVAERPSAGPRLHVWPALKWFLGLGLIVALPYYLLAGTTIFDYFWSNTRGNQSHIWSFPDTTSVGEVASEYLGAGYQRFVRYQLHAGLAIGVIAALSLALRGKWRDAAWLLLLPLIAACSFLVLVIGRHRNEFFLLTSQTLVLLFGIAGLGFVYNLAGKPARRRLLACAWFVLAVLVLINTRADFGRGAEEDLRGSSWNDRLAAEIAAWVDDHGGRAVAGLRGPTVFLSAAGPVNALSLRWAAAKMQLPLVTTDLHRMSDLTKFESAALAAHFVVVPDLVAAEFFRELPSANVQIPFAAYLAHDARFERLGMTGSPERYRIYRNKEVTDRDRGVVRMPSPGAISGFAGEEGPYPQWGLPRVRWMRASKASVCVFSSGTWELIARLRSTADAELVAGLPGRQKEVLGEVKAGAFSVLSHNFETDEHCSCLELDANWSLAAGAERGLMFTELRVERAQPRSAR